MTQFHIRWSGGKLDWQPFDTSAEAEEIAKDLAHPGELYAVEEVGEKCERCEAQLHDALKKMQAAG